QEALTNVARHAEAENAAISLSFKDGILRVEVEDDGKGFNLWSLLEGKDGIPPLGILGMRERAALLGGQLTIDTKPGRGTRVSVSVPLGLLR
ncbi:hypothetical protein LCGC14_2879460, partial [marine sediment metagenome]